MKGYLIVAGVVTGLIFIGCWIIADQQEIDAAQGTARSYCDPDTHFFDSPKVDIHPGCVRLQQVAADLAANPLRAFAQSFGKAVMFTLAGLIVVGVVLVAGGWKLLPVVHHATSVATNVRRLRQVPVPAPSQNEPPAEPGADRLGQLERLNKLRQDGALSAEEFAKEKQRLLDVGT